jgi:pyruvate/2-oxoglutarate dehydrogenase complex dihydrolipoamide dehydrogenase (E3) component
MSKFDYDLIVIGAGSGGISSAILGSNLGKRVALVEKSRIGGECTWSGCVPSKALIKAAEIAHGIGRAADFGLKLDGTPRLDARNVMTHVRSVVERVYEGETPEVFEDMGIRVHIGSPKFVDSHHLKVDETIISSKSFVIATGSRPFVPPIEGINDVPYLTNENLFELERLPDSLIVLGGGPIGSEMASALNRLGVNITIVEQGKHVLSREDGELAVMLMKCMMDEGVNVLCENRAVSVSKSNTGIRLGVKSERAATQEIEAHSLLVAVGRKPNVQDLNLEKAGVEYTPRGIQVDKTLRTTARNIYALGDVVGSYQFSHMAEYWATVAVPNAVLPIPIKKRANNNDVPWSTFTAPELARSGLTETEARESFGDAIRIYRYPYNKVDRAKTDLAEEGLSKIICTRKGKILGIHVLGAHAADLMHEVLMVKRLGATFDKVQDMIHAYPTYSDVIKRPAGRLYADKLRDKWIVKLVQKLRGAS